MILGIDEVGRGPWAGPLVVGAVVIPQDIEGLEGLTDSKKLSAKKRSELDVLIREKALGWGLGWVHPEELDAIGLSAALRLATIRAVEAVKVPYHEIIIDGTINFLKETAKGTYVTTMAKADLLIPAVSAASIIAKVARDSYMAEQDELYPEYGFGSHVGYGTAKHRGALDAHGVTPLHRKSFAPIAALLSSSDSSSATPAQTQKDSVTTTNIGQRGETRAVEWLQEQGFVIQERNWKTRYCEVDIIATKKDVIYCIEVKYRSSEKQGGGVAAITGKKLQQMKFAAEMYHARHAPTSAIRLAVVVINQTDQPKLIEIE